MKQSLDAYFKETFGQVALARDIFENLLEAEELASLDFSTLTSAKGSYVDEALQTHFSDVVYDYVLRKEEKRQLLCSSQSWLLRQKIVM